MLRDILSSFWTLFCFIIFVAGMFLILTDKIDEGIATVICSFSIFLCTVPWEG